MQQTQPPTDAPRAADAYVSGPRPLYTRVPISYRLIPLRVRIGVLRIVARLSGPTPRTTFPAWPIETSIDRMPSGHSYRGRRAAFVLTHDVDSRAELQLIDAIRSWERSVGLVSSWGFVPRVSWPAESAVRALVGDGCEIYWHDLAHDGRLPYMAPDAIREAFRAVDDASPWARELIHAFRAGQLLVSPALMDALAERFTIDMSIPDTEKGGPYGGHAGCGTVVPFRYRGVLELPLTIPQDVYARHVYGLSAEQTVELWRRKLAHVVDRGGVAVMVLHPTWCRPGSDLWDPARTFLEEVLARPDILVTTPSGVAAAMQESGG